MALQPIAKRLKNLFQQRQLHYSGQQVEKLAAKYLMRQQLQVLNFNYRCNRGEIDIIMLDQQTVVFVEVRYRRSNKFGTAVETVDFRKQQKLLITAEYFLQQQYHGRQPACRFDVIGAQTDRSGELNFTWIQNAFSY